MAHYGEYQLQGSQDKRVCASQCRNVHVHKCEIAVQIFLGNLEVPALEQVIGIQFLNCKICFKIK